MDLSPQNAGWFEYQQKDEDQIEGNQREAWIKEINHAG